MLKFPAAVIEEKNRIGSTAVWLVALEIHIPGISEPVRVVSNNENITWRGETWTAFPFQLGEIGDTAKGEVPQATVKVSNVNRTMETYLQNYDAFCKANGLQQITANIYVLVSTNLDDDTPLVEHVFELTQAKSTAEWVTFTLGASNPFNRRFPSGRIFKNFCRFKFGGPRCGYIGLESKCNKTLARCRQLGNSTRYGGFPGAGSGGIKIANV